jgi:multiple sugar transport system permease protein
MAKTKKIPRLMQKKYFIGYAMVAPFFVHFCIFLIYPYIATLLFSLTNRSLKRRTFRFVGLDNYMDVFQDPVFHTALTNTLIWQIFVPIGCVVLGLSLALLLNRKARGTSFYRVSTYVPVVVDWVAVSVIFGFLLDPAIGVINHILKSLGVPPQGFLTDPGQALGILVLIFLWKSAGYFSIFYLGALQNVNKSLLEAADIDGASVLQKFRNVTLPQIAPITVVVVIIAWTNAIKLLAPFYVMTSGGPARATYPLIMYFQETAFGFLQIGKGSAIAVIFTVLVLGVVLILRNLLNRMKGAEGAN